MEKCGGWNLERERKSTKVLGRDGGKLEREGGRDFNGSEDKNNSVARRGWKELEDGSLFLFLFTSPFREILT